MGLQVTGQWPRREVSHDKEAKVRRRPIRPLRASTRSQETRAANELFMAAPCCRRWLKGTNPIAVGQALIEALPTIGIWEPGLSSLGRNKQVRLPSRPVLKSIIRSSVSPLPSSSTACPLRATFAFPSFIIYADHDPLAYIRPSRGPFPISHPT